MSGDTEALVAELWLRTAVPAQYSRGAVDRAKLLEAADALAAQQDALTTLCRERDEALAREAGLRDAKVERDVAQSACTAWQGVFEDLEAHLLDRVAMDDPGKPHTYLSILRNSVAGVLKYSSQIVAARWHKEATDRQQIEQMEGEVEAIRDQVADLMEQLHQEKRLSAALSAPAPQPPAAADDALGLSWQERAAQWLEAGAVTQEREAVEQETVTAYGEAAEWRKMAKWRRNCATALRALATQPGTGGAT